MAFNLVNELFKEIKESQEKAEKQLEVNNSKVREMYEGTFQAVKESKYSKKGIRPEELIGYVQSKIAVAAPIYSQIVLKPFEVTSRNFIINTNGTTLFIGKMFFEESLEVVILETLKVCVDIALGHYVIPNLSDVNSEEAFLIKYSLREVHKRITNTVLRNNPASLGIISSQLSFTNRAISTCLTPYFKETGVNYISISNKYILENVKRAVASYLKTRLSGALSIISVRVGREIVNINIPPGLYSNYLNIEYLKRTSSEMRKNKQELLNKKQNLIVRKNEAQVVSKQALKENLLPTEDGNKLLNKTSSTVKQDTINDIDIFEDTSIPEDIALFHRITYTPFRNSEGIDYDEETMEKLSDSFTEHLNDTVTDILKDRIDSGLVTCTIGLLNEINEMMSEYGEAVQSQVYTAINAVTNSSGFEDIGESLKVKYDANRERGIYDLQESRLNKITQDIAEHLSEGSMAVWSKKFDEGLYGSYYVSVEDLLMNLYSSFPQEDKEFLYDYFSDRFRITVDALSVDSNQNDTVDEITGFTGESVQIEDNLFQQANQEELEEIENNPDVEFLSGEDSSEESGADEEEFLENLVQSINQLGIQISSINDNLNELDEQVDSIYMMLSSSSQVPPTVTDTWDSMECGMNESEYRILMQDMKDMVNSMPGCMLSSVFERNIADMYDIFTPWFTVVEKMVQKFLPTKVSSFTHPDKRYLYRNIILPGPGDKNKRNCIERLALYIDSSGSMEPKDLQIMKSMLRKLSKKLPKKTTAFEFNTSLHPLKVANGRLLEDPHSSGGTDIDVVLNNLNPRESGKVLSFVISDGDFKWSSLIKYLNLHPREKMVIIITRPDEKRELLESNLGFPRNRFLIVGIEDSDIVKRVEKNIQKF